ncbi:hypothetical protein TcasGA2_TC008601 [Tribolium castaneum]|uniref:Uncharacterized protein n=1 Tax=Tribolium castaneum TaxID=7070 RepID=D6WTP0_TRICA|nr:hypothetical protein TcasGA2_TC008601 [Tribolium castaneum]
MIVAYYLLELTMLKRYQGSECKELLGIPFSVGEEVLRIRARKLRGIPFIVDSGEVEETSRVCVRELLGMPSTEVLSPRALKYFLWALTRSSIQEHFPEGEALITSTFPFTIVFLGIADDHLASANH